MADNRIAGDVVLKCPVSITAATGLIVVLIIIGALVAIFGTYSRIETLNGWVAPDQTVSEVFAGGPGVIRSLAVAAGDTVAAGDVVAVITDESGGETELVAPATGRVVGVFGAEREAPPREAPLVTILPEGGSLRAVLGAPSTAIGLLEPGQEAELRYAAFPHQRYGAGKGRILSVSTTGAMPRDFSASGPPGGMVYRVDLSIDEAFIRAGDKELPVQPGMALSADVILERRSFLSTLTGNLLRGMSQ